MRNCEFEPVENGFKCKNCGTFLTQKASKNCLISEEKKRIVPSLAQRILNFGKASVKHVSSGMKHCSPEQREKRYNQCAKNECGLFLARGDGQGICSHEDCGCFIRSRGVFLDKLSWADSECPEGYWGPVIEKSGETPENGV